MNNKYLTARSLSAIRLGLCLFVFLQAASAWAQSTAAVNVAGSTHSACVVAASDAGHVGTADAGQLLQRFAMLQVAMKHEGIEKALVVKEPLQVLYSRLIPFTQRGKNRNIAAFVLKQNTKVIKQIADVYMGLQSMDAFKDVVVDILPVLVRGETVAAKQSVPFATFIANELHRQGVKRVRLNHVPLDPKQDPVEQAPPPAKS